MQSARKIRLLLAGCLLIVVILSGIQFYLVRNTYELTKRQYYAEVREAIDSLSQPFTDSANSRAMRLLKDQLPFYDNTGKNEFLHKVVSAIRVEKKQDDSSFHTLIRSNALLSGVGFNMNYRQIILVKNGISDTLLKTTDAPLVILGDDKAVREELSIGAGVQVTGLSDLKDVRAGSSLDRLEVKYTKLADISGWKQQVWKRMTGVFLLAIGLIAALIFLFYQVFRTLLKQKRIADITTDFANNMTHELKTPLSSIAIIIKSLKKETIRHQPEMIDELVNSLDRQHHKLQELTDQVLETALAEEGSSKPEPVGMPEFLQQTLLDFKNDTHRVESSIDKTPRLLKTDPRLLNSILENLLDNAAKYSEPGTTILLKSYTDARNYIIEISDQGRGITAEEQTRIFEKFYRVPEKDLHSVKGMGLGLYLCRARTGILGGTLSVRSRLGEGSTFIVKIPLRES